MTEGIQFTWCDGKIVDHIEYANDSNKGYDKFTIYFTDGEHIAFEEYGQCGNITVEQSILHEKE